MQILQPKYKIQNLLKWAYCGELRVTWSENVLLCVRGHGSTHHTGVDVTVYGRKNILQLETTLATVDLKTIHAVI